MTPLLSPAGDLGTYFRGGPYAFEIRFGRGTPEEFYGPTALHQPILDRRRALLDSFPARHTAALPGAEIFLAEAADLAVASGTVPPQTGPHDLARAWEPDFLILDRARLVYGAVCFPSSWDLAEKIGQPIGEIHAVVPGLNSALGHQIATFLDRLKPGISWTRSNWGLSRHPDWNQHPALRLPRLDHSVDLDEVFFRVEDQSLLALPQTGGILFGIRIKVFPLRLLAEGPARAGLRLALETMPEEMARYKGIAAARARILELLRPGA